MHYSLFHSISQMRNRIRNPLTIRCKTVSRHHRRIYSLDADTRRSRNRIHNVKHRLRNPPVYIIRNKKICIIICIEIIEYMQLVSFSPDKTHFSALNNPISCIQTGSQFIKHIPFIITKRPFIEFCLCLKIRKRTAVIYSQIKIRQIFHLCIITDVTQT